MYTDLVGSLVSAAVVIVWVIEEADLDVALLNRPLQKNTCVF